MSSETLPSVGALSQKQLKGIYWKTFVGFVKKDAGDASLADSGSPTKLQHRQGSFEYMELTARGGSSSTSDSTESCCSSDNLSTESSKDDKISMYAVLEMGNKREIAINEDITIIEESPDQSETATLNPTSPTASPAPVTPICSPILHVDSRSRLMFTPSPAPDSESLPKSRDEEMDDAMVTDGDNDEDSFDRLESISPPMESAPWKDQGLSIQLWMVPNLTHESDGFFAPFPEVEHCHYVPTLESILEESEESSEVRNLTRSRISKSTLFSDDTEIHSFVERPIVKRSNSLGDVEDPPNQSQEDLYSITSTFGSLNSMRRITTLENLITDEKEQEDSDSEGSSDELDKVLCDEALSDAVVCSASEKLESNTLKNCPNTELPFEEKSNSTDAQDVPSNHKVLGERTSSSTSTSSDSRKSDRRESGIPSTVYSDFLSSGRSSPAIESAPEYYDNRFSTRSNSLASVRRDSGVTFSDIDIPGFPKELYIDSRDIPKIVVMFAQQEIAKERLASQYIHEDEEDGVFESCKKSLSVESDDASENSYPWNDGAVPKRISQLRTADTSRLSTLSTSTPELSAVNDESLLYIPVSYASEAAAKKKKKRRSALSIADMGKQKTHSRTLISGAGIGNGFSSLRKRFKNRTGFSSPLRRSQSEKAKLSYSTPDISSPMSRFLSSPRRKTKLKRGDSLKSEGKEEKGLKKTVSNILRRLSSRLSSHSRPKSQKCPEQDVIEQISPAKSLSDAVCDSGSGTWESPSIPSSSKDSVETTPASTIERRAPFSNLSSPGTSAEDYRNRSQSVPLRPHSQPCSMRYTSIESEVFESLHSEEDFSRND